MRDAADELQGNLFKVVLKLHHGVLVSCDARTIARCIFIINMDTSLDRVRVFNFAEVLSDIFCGSSLVGVQTQVGLRRKVLDIGSVPFCHWLASTIATNRCSRFVSSSLVHDRTKIS